MKVLRLAADCTSPLAREEELCRKLEAARICGSEPLRLTISGRWLFVDGFEESVDQKSQMAQACRALAPQSILVSRLRVAVSEGPRVSWLHDESSTERPTPEWEDWVAALGEF